MKLNGVKIEGLNEEFIVLPRKDQDIVLKARAIPDYSEFEQLVPMPKPPVKIIKGGKRVTNTDDPRYKAGIEDYAAKRTNWMILKSLEVTDGLEWETIDMQKPETWKNFEKEIRASGFSEVELMKIIQMVMSASGLDESKLEKARADFLRSQEQPSEESSYQEDEQGSTLSGEPVSVSQ